MRRAVPPKVDFETVETVGAHEKTASTQAQMWLDLSSVTDKEHVDGDVHVAASVKRIADVNADLDLSPISPYGPVH